MWLRETWVKRGWGGAGGKGEEGGGGSHAGVRAKLKKIKCNNKKWSFDHILKCEKGQPRTQAFTNYNSTKM